MVNLQMNFPNEIMTEISAYLPELYLQPNNMRSMANSNSQPIESKYSPTFIRIPKLKKSKAPSDRFLKVDKPTDAIETKIVKLEDVKLENADWGLGLFIACKLGNLLIAEILMRQVLANFVAQEWIEAFYVACEYGHTHIVEAMLKQEVESTAQRTAIENGLKIATHRENVNLLTLLNDK